MKRIPYIGVIGAGACTEDTCRLAQILGRGIGERGWALVCGGLGGVMEAAAKGCCQAGSLTIGLLPGLEKESANKYIRVPVPTGLGEGRNLLVVRASDVLVAVSGGYGTLSEIALALKAGKPVVGLETWKDLPGLRYARGCGDALRILDELVEKDFFGTIRT